MTWNSIPPTSSRHSKFNIKEIGARAIYIIVNNQVGVLIGWAKAQNAIIELKGFVGPYGPLLPAC
jgi:hypothetical protein